MPRYRFVGDFERVMHGLAHGVSATLHRDGHDQPAGSTVVLQPGDEVTTDEPYEHAELEEIAASKRSRRSEKAADDSGQADTPAEPGSASSDDTGPAAAPSDAAG
jgi:hypothetical protein